MFIPGATPEQMDWFDQLQQVSTSPETAARIRRARGELDVTALAVRVNVPTLVLHARDDAVVSVAEGRQLATLLPEARFVPLAGANHILLADEPAWPVFSPSSTPSSAESRLRSPRSCPSSALASWRSLGWWRRGWTTRGSRRGST
jgi:pimeloyl-ACP methyl ester carboxylesterase